MSLRPSRTLWLLTSVTAFALALVPGFSRGDAQLNTPPIPGSFVYCHKGPGSELEVFAGEPTKSGALRFGVTLWAGNGHNLGLWGIAARTDKGWEYQDSMDAEIPAKRCRVRITHEMNGTLRLASVEGAVCGDMSHGGAGMEINDLRFAPPSYEGPVTWEMDSPDAFFNRAGRCAAAKTS